MERQQRSRGIQVASALPALLIATSSRRRQPEASPRCCSRHLRHQRNRAETQQLKEDGEAAEAPVGNPKPLTAPRPSSPQR
nr:hypothetical protein Iba_chr01bCG2360 [Ipomoea batatas]GMC56553.1 hypothetical protein Iba_chr01fCG8200 [Ipomoea batatas]GME21820.1 hypothetical protein Iba_scaffold29360CG0020 [Ipomoea batatas]